MLRLGFIGAGNMGGALALAAAKKEGNSILLSDKIPGKAEALAEKTGGSAVSNAEIAERADYIFLGVKPQMLAETVGEIKDALKERTDRFVLVTMAAGTSMEKINELAGGSYPIIRIMPNTPVSVGEGMVLYTSGYGVTDGELGAFLSAFSEAGRFAEIPERLIDAGASVAGCGPAFVDLFAEALTDGGVACGIPRALAQELAAQMIYGSAKLILESGKHPGELKDAVCSPGGTTIQGVRALEEGAFRASVMNAVIAAYEKNFNL
ncbi:MAG: pyrroline-5-carboxylate reductase [Oscillospiraceae bacterium]